MSKQLRGSSRLMVVTRCRYPIDWSRLPLRSNPKVLRKQVPRLVPMLERMNDEKE